MIEVLMIIAIIITAWLGLSVLYMLIYSMVGLYYKEPLLGKVECMPSVAVLIPAYKEDAVIVGVAEEALTQEYTGQLDVVVIADSLQEKTIDQLKELPIKLVEVDFEKSTKAKALNFAMKQIGDDYDVAMILDADNVMEKSVLKIMGTKYQQGAKAIQGHRCAKNQETKFAFLDAISEEVNNHLYCKGPAVLGLSSRLVGSGMAFDYGIFKRLMASIDAVGGFDKELELKLIKEGVTIQYLHSALIYDEKVSKSEVFEKQRTRWISAQYHYMLKVMPIACVQLVRGNFDYFYKALQLALPPRLLLPGVLFVFGSLLLLLGIKVLGVIWLVMFVANIVAYTAAIPAQFWNKELWKGVVALPQAFFITLKAMFKLKGANTKFIHTPHTVGKVISSK